MPWPLRARFGLRLVVLLAFVTAHVLAARHLYRAYPWSWSWSELLIDYQGGFVKRGLLGEAAYRVQDVMATPRLVVGVLLVAYVLTSAVLILFLRLPDELPGLLFLLSPAGGLFALLNPAAYGRKDAFVVAAIVSSLVVIRRQRRPIPALIGTMGIFAAAGLLVEISWFYYPLVFAALLFRWRGRSLRWRLGACAAAVAYTLGCLLLTLRAGPVDTAAIAESWHRMPYGKDDTGALCCLNFGFSEAFAIARSNLPLLGTSALAAAIGAVPLALLLTKRPPPRMDGLTKAVALVGILAAIFPAFVTADWGRYIYLWLSGTFLWAWTVTSPRPAPAAPPASGPPDLYGLVMRAVLVALYASSWQLVHFQFVGRSALIPGALFRAVGGSGETPLAD